jgi:hypothetical protein
MIKVVCLMIDIIRSIIFFHFYSYNMTSNQSATVSMVNYCFKNDQSKITINHLMLTFFIFSSFTSLIIDRPERLDKKLLSKEAMPSSCCLFFTIWRRSSSWTTLISSFSGACSANFDLYSSFLECASLSLLRASSF